MRKFSALAAALVAAAIAVPLSIGSSHREAPNTLLDPAADETDLYAFTAEDQPDDLTVVGNWIPFQEPAGGPNFYPLDPKARYYINVDNTGDGVYDVRYRFTFRTIDESKQDLFAVAVPEVTSLRDPQLFRRQEYSLVRETYKDGDRTGAKRIVSHAPTVPSNFGPRTMPDYENLSRRGVRGARGGGKVFVGQRDDPFYIDLGTIFDSVNFRPGTGTGNMGGGVDDVAPFNVSSFVLQVPEERVTRNGEPAEGGNATVGVWLSTERRQLEVTDSDRPGRGEYTQVSRLGNALVNELLIPLTLKDRFNRRQPSGDAEAFGKFLLEPGLAAAFNQLFPGVTNCPTKDRTDLVTLLQGFPGLNRQVQGDDAPAVDTLKLNLSTPPTSNENRFGVIAGDNAGYPNGRRLGDDVVDISARVVCGYLKGRRVALGDGVVQNDDPFLSKFPYVPAPTSGFDRNPERQEPPTPPDPADFDNP